MPSEAEEAEAAALSQDPLAEYYRGGTQGLMSDAESAMLYAENKINDVADSIESSIDAAADALGAALVGPNPAAEPYSRYP